MPSSLLLLSALTLTRELVSGSAGRLIGPRPACSAFASQASFSHEKENAKTEPIFLPSVEGFLSIPGEDRPSKCGFCLWSAPWFETSKTFGLAFVRKTSWHNRGIQVFWTWLQIILIPVCELEFWGDFESHCSKWFCPHIRSTSRLPVWHSHWFSFAPQKADEQLVISCMLCTVSLHLLTFIDSKQLFCR